MKSHGRARSSSASSSSSEWESSPHSNGRSRRNTSNRGRRDFAERKELRGGNSPPLPPQTSSRKTSEPAKVKRLRLQNKFLDKKKIFVLPYLLLFYLSMDRWK